MKKIIIIKINRRNGREKEEEKNGDNVENVQWTY